MNQNDFEPKTAPKWLSSLYDRTYTIRKPKQSIFEIWVLVANCTSNTKEWSWAQCKILVSPTYFLPNPKTVLKLPKLGLHYHKHLYSWKANGKEISKSMKTFWPTPLFLCPSKQFPMGQKWTEMIWSLKIFQITIFSDKQCLVTCCTSNTEDWSWAECDEHITM